MNGFGCATAEQIRQFMQVGQTAAYVRIRKLVDAGYIVRDRILHGQARIHKVSKVGTIASGDALLPLRDIHLGTFKHDLKLVDLALMLEAETGGRFHPDRRIRHDEGLSGVGQLGHIADGYLYIGDDKPIAIELELSIKSRARIRSIINGYGGDLSVKEVWYFTDQQTVATAIYKAAKDYPFIKIKMISSIRKTE